MAVILRKHEDGRITSEGDLPKTHEFTTRWLVQAIDKGIASAEITLNLEKPVVYKVTGFRVDDEREDQKTLTVERAK